MGVDNRDRGASINFCAASTSGTWWNCEGSSCDDKNWFQMVNVKPIIWPDSLTESCSSVAASSTEASKTTAPGGDCAASFSGGQMTGVGLGVGLPLLFAFLTVLWLLLFEKRKSKGTAKREGRLNPRNAPPGFESAYYKPIAWNTGDPRDSETIELCGNPSEIRNRNTDSPP